jgi:RNA polymerase-binding transcription factor DksA
MDILIFSFLIALFVFAYVYWKDATEEGFGSDHIFDSIVSIMIAAFLGGKILFRDISFEFFRYQFLSASIVLEGALIGGGLAAYYIVKKYKWDGWKIGDMIAPALSLFQAIIFAGIWWSYKLPSFLVLFISFFTLYALIRFLKKKKHIGASSLFFMMKRLDKPVFTGGLLATYLTVSSAIAILFLSIHHNVSSRFWWFQLVFYLVILVVSFVLIRKQLYKQDVPMIPQFTREFLNKMRNRLLHRKAEIKDELKEIKSNDPFQLEVKTEGTRNEDELGDEVADYQEHDVVEAESTSLQDELHEIDQSLEDLKQGTYGISKKTGKKIAEKRLEANPTATANVDE